MEAHLSIPTDPRVVEAALEGLTRANVEILRKRRLPRLYKSGVRYQRERSEHWRPANVVLGDGFGDCEDLAAWRAAERRLDGERGARAVVRRTGHNTLHATVTGPRGDEDPSRRLGMGQDDDDDAEGGGDVLGAEDLESVDLGADPMPEAGQRVTFHLRRDRDGWRGEVRIPAGVYPDGTPAAITISPKGAKGAGKSKRTAAQKAGKVVGKILDSKEFAQVQQSLPPQAQAAIMAIQVARKSKALRKVANKTWKTVKGWFD